MKLFDKRGDIIDAFVNKNILLGDLEEDLYQEEKPEYEESIAERTKMKRKKSTISKRIKNINSTTNA